MIIIIIIIIYWQLCGSCNVPDNFVVHKMLKFII